MVWFQCEDCGEDLKKPKLANHFRMCSAYKLSCIDCGQTFSQETVQSHTQCISEADKYGPKDQGKLSHNGQAKPSKPKPEVDVNVGLSSRPPWFCSLCKTSATSKQTLMLHADGKKHRAKARAFHAAQKQSSQEENPTAKEGTATDIPNDKLVEGNGSEKIDKPEERDPPEDTVVLEADVENENRKKSKRRHDAPSGLATKTQKITGDSNGEVMQAEQTEEPQHQAKKKKRSEVVDKNGCSTEASQHKIKWKKLITSTLKSVPDGVMKVKKLQKLVVKTLRESGVTDDESQLRTVMMDKINSSSRFIIDNKRIRLTSKVEGS